MTLIRIKDALAGKVAVGTTVTIQGWIRSRRDSKAGLSFVQVHDGTCFDPLQVVAPGELSNYQDEVTRLTTGCSVSCTGTLVESQGKGQAYEVQADEVKVIGWVEDPEPIPFSPSATPWNTCARSPTCVRAPTPSAPSPV